MFFVRIFLIFFGLSRKKAEGNVSLCFDLFSDMIDTTIYCGLLQGSFEGRRTFSSVQSVPVRLSGPSAGFPGGIVSGTTLIRPVFPN
jgi:hypothetical protein